MAASLAATFTIGASSACAQQQDDEAALAELVVDQDDDDLAWNDQPQTQGTWFYEREGSETFALFGSSAEDPLAIIRCDLTTRKLGIGRFNTASQSTELMMRVRTETRQSLLTAIPKGNGDGLFGVELEASNPLLDAMAITKGRFAIEVEGVEPLYIPAWAEVTRVIEDCR